MAKLTRAVGVLFSLLLVVSCAGSASNKADKSKETAQLTKTEKANTYRIGRHTEDHIGKIDLGTLSEGERVESSFTIVNEMEIPLVIQNLKGSCGCITPEYSRKPIAVGDSQTITFYYDSKGKKGKQINIITIDTNFSNYLVEVNINVKNN